MESPVSTSITQPEAVAITALALLTSLLFVVSTLERTFVSKHQHDGSSFASTRTLTWQHPLVWYYLWLFRGAMSIIACLLPLAPMWVELAFEQKFGFTGVAAVWATSALVACISSGIVGERLLYLSFTASLNLEQVTCTILSIAGVVLLILGELTSVVPVPIAWSVTGAALHRFSMVLWWYIVTNKAYTSPQFRGRARITLAGHGVAFACVFLSFLPIFQDSLNRLFWLFAIFISVELITTAQAARMTYINWVTRRPMAHPAAMPRSPSPSFNLSTIHIPLHRPATPSTVNIPLSQPITPPSRSPPPPPPPPPPVHRPITPPSRSPPPPPPPSRAAHRIAREVVPLHDLIHTPPQTHQSSCARNDGEVFNFSRQLGCTNPISRPADPQTPPRTPPRTLYPHGEQFELQPYGQSGRVTTATTTRRSEDGKTLDGNTRVDSDSSDEELSFLTALAQTRPTTAAGGGGTRSTTPRVPRLEGSRVSLASLPGKKMQIMRGEIGSDLTRT